jgi:hypothetical protein
MNNKTVMLPYKYLSNFKFPYIKLFKEQFRILLTTLWQVLMLNHFPTMKIQVFWYLKLTDLMVLTS